MNAAGQGSSPLLSPVLSDAGGARMEEDEEMKRKVRKCDWERVYRKQGWFRVRSCACWSLNVDCATFCGRTDVFGG